MFQPIYHVSVSPTLELGPYKDRGKLWTNDLRVWSPLLHRLSYKVRREQVVGNEDVNGTAMNMEGLRCISNEWTSTYIISI